MNQPTPAIVAQSAVRRLPRLALLLLCLAYVLPGFIGRDPWRNSDLASFGYMVELAQGNSSFLKPLLMGMAPEVDGLLPYWLGAWAMKVAPAWVSPDFAARIPFGLLLALTLAATWWAVYYLARSARAQPVAFAFGGEALPTDYARAMADGGLLALIASLGLAQLSHETTPALVQLAGTALAFYGFAALAWRRWQALVALTLGLVVLALSGAPAMGVLFGLGAALLVLVEPQGPVDAEAATPPPRRALHAALIVGLLLVASAVAAAFGEWRWRVSLPHAVWREWRSMARLVLWFTWPALPLALWTLWRWRRQLTSRHVALPLWFFLVALVTTVATASTDRSMLLGLPALAALAAFALPTFRRSAAALIDWFTLIFFSGSAIVIWVVWISLQTGVPAKPAANVARLAPGFEPHFSATIFVVALLGTLAWGWIVYWRAGRHRAAVWKSLVLPASGATLCWLLITTLWLPAIDYARSYAPMVRGIAPALQQGRCVESFGLNQVQVAGFQFHGDLRLQPARAHAACDWLLVDTDAVDALPLAVDMRQWKLYTTLRRPADRSEDVQVYRQIVR